MQSDKNVFYVYMAFQTDSLVPIYIGKGCGNRWKAKHVSRFNCIKAASNLTETVAYSLERTLISAYGRACTGEGPLINKSTGGDGGSHMQKGREVSQEERERIRSKLLGIKRNAAKKHELNSEVNDHQR